MSRIRERLEALRRAGRKGFIPYLTAGDPNLETTARLIRALEIAGADVIELGVPFSDPIADGPVIQRASERALRRGTRLRDCLDIVADVRRQSDIPIVLFSYLNPLLQFGLERLAKTMAAVGLDGVLVTDLVPEEAEDFRRLMRAHGIETIFLAAPTSTDERIAEIARSSSGFIYVVSRTGVTGTREQLSEAMRPTVERVRRHTDLPIAVGFGISHPEHVRESWRYADAAVVGSALVQEIERHAGAPDLVERIARFAQWLKTGAAEIPD
ncbi:MAG: tryptophan synthase subunit alpha [Blastocatellia bacterium]|nr:tryptophan synthase subunit alpha [Blastocatellia bacterium]MCS7158229.1 tryptophan synthase subunit alpha [Blastocatellia bacterium]MDW8169383.1 tryptophan synthase subunit alpha [Acidobacteriota bacterium]MDW8256450.1 tryptophan synthase subunit alpha [Acidobacteriota bacterium]